MIPQHLEPLEITMSTPAPTGDNSPQAREDQIRLDERRRCIDIIAAELPGQDKFTAALLTRIVNRIVQGE